MSEYSVETRVEHRPFGRTGLPISRLSIGGGWVGGLLIDADETTKIKALNRAGEAGINWIDTAPSYGDTRSETAIGQLLPQLNHRFTLSTKFRIDAGAGDFIGQIERSYAGSLERLGVDRVPVVKLHNPVRMQAAAGMVTPEDCLKPGDGIIAAAETLKARGQFDHFGMTAVGDTEAVLPVLQSGAIDTAQVYFNMLNPSAYETVGKNWSGQDFSGIGAACRKHNVGVMIIRIYAAGLLASTERHGREIAVADNTAIADEEQRAAAVARSLGDAYGSLAKAALRFGLAAEDCHNIVIGFAKHEHLETALQAYNAGAMDGDGLARLQNLWRTDFKAA